MDFVASPWLRNRHVMTIFGSVARVPRRLPVWRERFELPDGDFLDVDRLAGPRAESPLVVVCHGLEGSSEAGYVRGLLAEAAARGLAGAAMNFRGCSGELNRLPRLYHSGETSDLAWLVERLAAEVPGRPILLAGYSLGGNVVAKYLGERGAEVPEAVRAAAVVSVPFDLALCARALDGPGVPAFVYRERFLRRLRRKAIAKAARFPELIDVRRVRAARTLHAFDEAVTAPLHGFESALDYWARSSSGPYLGGVRRPLHILAAEDDPFIPPQALPRETARANAFITLETFREGGHVAFVQGPPWRPSFWAERRIAELLAAAVS